MSDLKSQILSPEQLELYSQILARENLSGARPSVRSEIRASGQLEFPLCSFQQPLWFIDLVQGGDTAHNVVYPMGLPEGDLDVDALQAAIERMADRQKILRTVIRVDQGVPVQVIRTDMPLPLEYVDLTHLSTEDAE